MSFISLIHMLCILMLIAFNGMILFYVLYNKLFLDRPPFSETQLFAHALFFSFILNGILGQYLALFHLFRPIIFIVILFCLILIFPKDSRSIINCLLSIPFRFINLIKKGDLLQFLVWCIFMFCLLLLLFKVQLRVPNMDIWYTHIPIADSIVNHNGFVYPIINDSFHQNMPSFVELLYAEGLLFTDNYSIASIIHYSIFISFLLLLYSFAIRYKALSLVILILIMINRNFYGWAVTGMTDTARVCFDVVSIVFLLFYFKDKSKYYLYFSALSCGAALASKYLGLLTLFVIGLIFLINFHWDKQFFKKVGIYAIGVIIVCGFWYGKNTLIHKNPLYPFMGHSVMVTDLNQVFEFQPLKDRKYRQDILSLNGWRDFIIANYKIFFHDQHNKLLLIFSVMVGALLFTKYSINYLIPLSILYYILWYFYVFHTSRYGLTGYLLFYTGFYFCVICLSEKAAELIALLNNNKLLNVHYKSIIKFGNFLLLALVLILSIKTLGMKNDIYDLLRDNKGLVMVYLGKVSYDDYMTTQYYDYEMYNFIAKNKIVNVFSPVDCWPNGFMKYLIPGDKPDNIFISWNLWTKDPNDIINLFKTDGLKYFIVVNDNCHYILGGENNVDIAKKMLAELIPKSELIYCDKRGYKLYKVKNL